jgi:type IV secretory pathway VirB4 component
MATKEDLGNSLDLVDIKEIRDNTVIGKDGGLRQIVMVGGVNFALKSDMDQTIMTQAYQNFLNGIEFPLQVVIHSRKVNIEKYADDLLRRKDSESSPIIQNQIDEYVQFIKGFVEKNAIMEKMFFVVVPFYPLSVVPSGVKSSGSGLMGLFGKKNKVQQTAADAKTAEEVEKAFKESLEQLNQRVEQVTTGLTGIGLETTVLNDEQLTELFYNFYNPQTVERKEVGARE